MLTVLSEVPRRPFHNSFLSDELVRLGARVRELRLERGVTQQQLAEPIGVHRVNLNKFEHGRTDLGVSHIRRLSEALGVDPGRLFG